MILNTKLDISLSIRIKWQSLTYSIRKWLQNCINVIQRRSIFRVLLQHLTDQLHQKRTVVQCQIIHHEFQEFRNQFHTLLNLVIVDAQCTIQCAHLQYSSAQWKYIRNHITRSQVRSHLMVQGLLLHSRSVRNQGHLSYLHTLTIHVHARGPQVTAYLPLPLQK